MGWLRDFGRSLDDTFHDAMSGMDDAMKSIGRANDDFWSNVGGATDDLIHGDLPGVEDRIKKEGSEFDDTGHDLFGTGGWGVPIIDYFTGGWGPTVVNTYTRLKGDKPHGGSLSPGRSLADLYNMGSNIYNNLTAPQTASREATVDYSSNPDLNQPTATYPGQEISGAWSNSDPGNINFGNPSYASAGSSLSDNWSNYMPSPTYDLSGEGGLGNFNNWSTNVPSINNLNSPMGNTSAFGDLWNKFKGGPFGQLFQPGGNGGYNPLIKAGAGLAGTIYMSNRDKKRYENQMGLINNQVAGLQQMFSPNSPYAQNMRRQMERADAAGGRRSQYGTRETQLAGNLATQQAGVNQNLAQLYSSPGYTGLNQGISSAEGAPYKTAIGLMGNPQVMRNISDLFGG